MAYFACAYFDKTYFSTDCAPTGGKAARGPRVVILPPDPLLVEDEELLWIT